MPIFRLNDDLVFPDPAWADADGLLAVGGDLSAERLVLAYRLGIFPWYGPGEPILWWSPDPRCVLDPAAIHVSRRLRRRLLRNEFEVTVNRAFNRVIRACADVRLAKGEETWLIPEMQKAFRALHRMGYAHSVEAWQEGRLQGGLYGVALKPFFFGESMFHIQTDASKFAMAKFNRHLAARGFTLFDCQVPNPHLLSMGAANMPRRDFLAALERSLGTGSEPDSITFKTVFPDRL